MQLDDNTSKSNWWQRMNQLGHEGKPFLFLLDYELREPRVIELESVKTSDLKFAVGAHTNAPTTIPYQGHVLLEKHQMSLAEYRRGFDYVMQEIRLGNSFLLNYTVSTPITCSLNTEQIFTHTQARYKVWLRDRFVCFSPEIFVQIDQDGRISSNPMKGTIEATLPHADQMLLADNKELAEHYTIVDLIRNDLSMVSTDVQVPRFRYLERLHTNRGDLLQTSSIIKGHLRKNWKSKIGTIFRHLLPAGSISGAPKKRTMQIIRAAEGGKRGYYTGVCGIFDGAQLDSGVMIRYIEETPEGLVFKSGGGITCMSKCEQEYAECMAKVYLPLTQVE